MKLATIRTAAGTAAVRLDGARAVETGAPDVAALLRRPDWRTAAAAADGPAHEVAALDFAPVVTTPSKIFCVGHNYRTHIAEMGREMPSHPALFGKFANVLLGARDDIVHPGETEELDWEAELGFVIGSRLRRRAARRRRRPRSPATPSSTTSPCGTGSGVPRSGCRARRGRPAPRPVPGW